MKHLSKKIIILFIVSFSSFANIYEDEDNVFLKPEHLFTHQPIEIKNKELTATLLSVRQKDGVGFYLLNGKEIDYVTGVRFTNKVESIFLVENNIVILLSSKSPYANKIGTMYDAFMLNVSIDREKKRITLFNQIKSEIFTNCFDGIYPDGKVSTCTLNNSHSIKKYLNDIKPK